MKKLKRQGNGYITLHYADTAITVTADEVEMDVVSYVEDKHDIVEPLIPYLWNQQAPFSDAMPIFENVKDKPKAAVGCTQIALGMVAAYYGNVGVNGVKYRKGMDKTAEYISKSGSAYQLTIPALDAVKVFDYDAFNLCKGADFDNKAKVAVGEFLKHIAFSNHASFGVSGTSCSLSRALSETINKRMRLAKKALLISVTEVGIEEFCEKVLEELKQGHPVLMASNGTKTTDGIKSALGHSYVCDGWKEGKFHFNFGMATAFNGWYHMDNVTTKYNGVTWDFTHTTKGDFGMQAIINLHPNEV